MSDNSKPSEYMGTREVAASLRVGEPKVRAWILTGRLKAYDVGEGSVPKWRIRRDDLHEFLSGRQA